MALEKSNRGFEPKNPERIAPCLYLRRQGDAASYIFKSQSKHRPSGEISIGSAHLISEATAIEIAAEYRDKLAKGVDVFEERRNEKKLAVTFGQAADEMQPGVLAGLKNEKHKAQWKKSLEVEWKALRNKPISRITADQVEKVLRPMWEKTPETAERSLERANRVFIYAISKGYRLAASPAAKSMLKDRLGKKPKNKAKVKHHASMPWRDVPAFWVRLRKAAGIAALGLQWTILTAARSGETRGMQWKELDLKNKLWTVPEGRMKGEKEHVVPLSDAAIAVLDAMPQGKPDDLVFPGAKEGVPMSDMTLAAVLKRLKVPVTVHGFRASFKDWGGANGHEREHVEEALSHQIGNAVERAYKREALLKQRREVLSAWATYVTTAPKEPDSENVVPLRA
ncbi:tyrosine-type recombinase/integrase [Bradyrhizobium sp. BRP14]|nr:tyrosine-type recombinase/integrase [Bradyrhizobium sp. BRP14]